MPQSRVHCHHRLDRFGAMASGLCAVHCAAIPILVSVASGLHLGILADERVEWGLISTAAVIGAVSLASGYRQHRQPTALWTMTAGLALLILGRILHNETHAFGPASVFSVLGGLTVASAHLWNVRLAHRHCAHEEENPSGLNGVVENCSGSAEPVEVGRR